MNHSLIRRCVCLASLTLCVAVLAGCSHDNPPPATAAATATPFAAVARGRIVIAGGLLKLGAPREGTLTEVAAHEGDNVHQGQVLAKLDAEPGRLAVEGEQAALKQAQAQKKLIADKLKTARVQAHRLAAAAKAGAGDGQSADVAQAAVTNLDAEGDAAAAAVAMARQKLDSARYEQSLRTIKAPADAQVVTVTAQVGASVQPGAPLFDLLPQTPRLVRAELNASFANAVHPGMAARVSLDDDPDGTALPAHVTRVGNMVGPATLDEDPLQHATERAVICMLTFDQPQPLRVGQRVLVRFEKSGEAATASSAAKAR